MDDWLRLSLTALLAPAVAWVMWEKIARPVGRWVVLHIPPGYWKDVLTKDRGGHY
jgi:hypothetical protein